MTQEVKVTVKLTLDCDVTLLKADIENKVKDIIFQARTLKSDWLDEFYSLDEEAANQDYNPCFKYSEQELIESLLPKTEWNALLMNKVK